MIMKPDESQQSAIDNISRLSSSVYLLIGGAGCGKTFTIRHLLTQLWKDDSNAITDKTTYLAGPTGKSAKVINDSFAADRFVVSNDAQTIHRLLEFNPGIGWQHNKDNKLDASMVILDEASMVDSRLLSRVIEALPKKCILILVGDDAQLPPVAPGQPFTDLINHGPKEMINRLTTNHRQQQGSLIANGCLSVLDGNIPTWGKKGEYTLRGTLEDDLFFIEEDDKEEIPAMVADICRGWSRSGLDYAVLSPQKTGVCGVDALNKYLQAELNPPSMGKGEVKVGWVHLRQWDRVLQTKNNYELGVFNGFTGVVVSLGNDIDGGHYVVVDFDGELIRYEKPDDIKQLALGYCMTVHKAQGSAYDKGVLVCHYSHYYMWSRSLLYTGVSRFKGELHVIGDKRAVKRGLSNVVSGERNTFLKLKLEAEVVI